MSDTVIAAQLYTVREFTKTPEDIAKTMKKVKDIGYGAVQLSALGPIDPNELKKILDAEELVACASHVSFEDARNKTEEVIEQHKILGCKYVAIASMPGQYRSADGYSRFAKEASEIGKNLPKLDWCWGIITTALNWKSTMARRDCRYYMKKAIRII